MHKLRSYIVVFFLAILLFPIAEKLKHELMSVHDDLCSEAKLHFCEKEHDCQLCNYVFSISSWPPSALLAVAPLFYLTTEQALILTPKPFSPSKYFLFFRGPPVC